MRRKMTYNGILLEEAIPGYRTLSIDGRQFNEVDIEANDNPGDGADFISKRIPERKLTISFMLKQTEQLSLRQAQDKLLSVLNQDEPKQLILSDEPDVYFNAIFEKAKINEEHDRIRSGELTFICHDPFKHAIEKKSFTAEKVDGILTATIENTGNVAVPIEYEINMNSDNGFIGIVSKNGVMQYGFVEEADGETYEQSEVLKNTEDMFNAPSDPTGTQCVSDPTFVINGELGAIPWSSAPAKKWLAITKDIVIGNWHGGQKTIQINADSEGHIGAKNFMCYWRRWFQKGRIKQRGFQSLFFLDAEKRPICGTRLGAYSLLDGYASLDFVLNGKIVKNISTKVYGENDLPFNANRGHDALTKEGGKVTFYYSGNYFSYYEPEIENAEIKYIQINLSKWASDEGVTRNYIGVLTFTKLHVEKWKDNPNRYARGDSLLIDGNDSKVYVNDLVKMGDEIVGTEYFKALPGDNTIQIYNSSWAEDVTAKAWIREAWL